MRQHKTPKSADTRLAQMLGEALKLERAGHLQSAAELLLRAGEAFPSAAQPFERLGNLLAGAGDWPQAEVCYDRALALGAVGSALHCNRGITLLEQGRLDEAISGFEAAIGLKPDHAAAFFGLCLVYQRLGALDAAQVAIDCAIQAAPEAAAYRTESARLLVKGGRWADALAALSALSGGGDAWNLKGLCLRRLDRADEALAAYERALQLQPDSLEALNNRANLRLLARQFAPALADYENLERASPRMDWVPGLRLYAAMHQSAWTGFPQALERVCEALAEGRRAIQPLALQCVLDDPVRQQQAARIWAACVMKPQPTPRPAAPGGRIRIAYVSRDFKAHPVSFLMAEVVELHDRNRFEVIALNYGRASADAMQARLRAGFDRFLDVEDLPDEGIVRLARELQIDIAIDLSGYTDGARSSLFAARLAPVQASYLGYLGTMGSAAYDYLITDPVLIPPRLRHCYDERLILLPSYQSNDRQRPRPVASVSREALGLPAEGWVYCCFNNPCKIVPAVFDDWMQILAAVPGAVLWMLAESVESMDALREQARQRGIESSRLVFASRVGRDDYLAQLGLADLFLDTLPYNAGTTASDALWMGVPVLTRAGEAMAGRIAASLLTAAGLPELITADPAAYVRLAVELAQDADRWIGIKRRWAEAREHCTLFDTPRFVRTLEAAFEKIHDLSCQDRPPEDVWIEPAAGSIPAGEP